MHGKCDDQKYKNKYEKTNLLYLSIMLPLLRVEELGGCDPRCRAARQDCWVSRERCTTERRTAATAARSSNCTAARSAISLQPGHVRRGLPQLTLYTVQPCLLGSLIQPGYFDLHQLGLG